MVVVGARAEVDRHGHGDEDGDSKGSSGSVGDVGEGGELEVGSNGSHRENGEETDSLPLSMSQSLVVETDSSTDTDTAANAEILRKERQLLISRVKVRTPL